MPRDQFPSINFGDTVGVPTSLFQLDFPVQTSDNDETDITNVVVPAGALGVGGNLKATLAGFLTVGGAAGATTTYRLRLGAALLGEIVVTDTDLSVATFRVAWAAVLSTLTGGTQAGGMIMDYAVAGVATQSSAQVALGGVVDPTVNQTLRLTMQTSDVTNMVANFSYADVESARAS